LNLSPVTNANLNKKAKGSVMIEQDLQISTRNYITTLTINRPHRRNALTYELLRTLKGTLEGLADDQSTRVVVLRGAGERSFSSGMDLNTILEDVKGRPASPLDHELITQAMQAVEVHPNPVIAMINGDALAGGCELALHCDFRLMADTARIGMPLVKRGLMIQFPLIRKLVQVAGPFATAEILIRGAPINATRAREMGLVNQVLPQDHLEVETIALADELAANAPLAVRAFKEGIRKASLLEADRYSEDMHALLVQVMTSEDAREGLQAFLEKRPPEYKGR
jgi:enoyl-CoA hydratase